jgi:hypothetical protein
VWHASAALLGESAPRPVRSLSPDELQCLYHACRRLLRGVGEGRDVWNVGEAAIHLRRRVRPAEFDHAATDERRLR